MDTDIVGMAIRGGTIYYCAWEEGLKKLSLSDNLSWEITMTLLDL
jgi:hypothetical protein